MTKAQRALLISIVATVALYAVPQLHALAWPLILLSTLAHELGHGIAAMLVGCSFDQLVMYADASGVARWSGDPGRFARAAISAGGLMGPSIVAGALFGVARNERSARIAAMVLGVVLLAVDVLWVRNLFGFGFVALLGAGLLGLSARASAEVTRTTLLFVACQLALSVFSRGDYLFTDVAHTGAGVMPSDVAHIQAALILPYWIWGGFIGLLSVAVLWAGVRPWIRDSLPSVDAPKAKKASSTRKPRRRSQREG
ncbi:MAG: M50 family peptidase [Deltaproteobacteria bacterium]|nr:MAG: M50 family peptidase [Deltaproteobacteria bacterium]